MLVNSRRIVLIGKDAVPGQVKTRLQPDLSAEHSANLYKELALHTCLKALETGVPVEVSFRGNQNSPFALQLRKLGCSLYSQKQDDLGKIIHRALHRADRVVAMGMDMPLVTTQEILDALNQNNLVFGPAEDGGYWLIAGSKPLMCVFECIDWSTERVLKQSVQQCRKNKIHFSFAQTHYDIDTISDFHRLLHDPLLRHLRSDQLALLEASADFVRARRSEVDQLVPAVRGEPLGVGDLRTPARQRRARRDCWKVLVRDDLCREDRLELVYRHL